MDIERSRQLDDIIRLSHKMLSRARDGEWTSVAELDAKRREMILHCFREPTPEQDAPEVALLIRELLRLNKELTDLGHESRERLGSEIQTQNVGRAAQAAYANCAR